VTLLEHLGLAAQRGDLAAAVQGFDDGHATLERADHDELAHLADDDGFGAELGGDLRHVELVLAEPADEKAEAAYLQANERGRKPQPGLSLLRLAQGEIDAAAASIRSVLLDTRSQAARARMLAAAVEILVAAGDVEPAREAASELSTIAGAIGAPLLSAASAHATGAVLLAEGDVAGAATLFCQASEIWRELEMPYEEARTRVLMAAVCERRSDLEGHHLEVEAAQRLFRQLDVEFSAPRVGEPPNAVTSERVGLLSERETQVLRLLASGKTNRAIAGELFISEKTVARHVSNIFDKLGVSTRSAATAWAYQRDLL
jgi:DNA-binding CsgD family transcriptional regulator